MLLHLEPGIHDVPEIRRLETAVIEERGSTHVDLEPETGTAVEVDEFGELVSVTEDIGFHYYVVEGGVYLDILIRVL